MSRDHFFILGLKPGRYDPGEIARRFYVRRQRLLAELDDPVKYVESRRQLDALYRAYTTLCDPQRQAEHVQAARREDDADDRVARLRRMIESCLEGGLLRYSRRAEILAEGRRLGFSAFHVHLMIAQVQFGEEIAAPPFRRAGLPAGRATARVGARFAAVGLLALAIFLAMVRWLGT
jgi:uncharacterized protein YhaN